MEDFYLFVTHNGARRITDQTDTEREEGILVSVKDNKAIYTQDGVEHIIVLDENLNSDADIAAAVSAYVAAVEEQSHSQSIDNASVAFEHDSQDAPVREHIPRGHGPVEPRRIEQHVSDYVGEQVRSAGRDYDRLYARDSRVSDVEAQFAMFREEIRTSFSKLSSELSDLKTNVISDLNSRVDKTEQSQQKIIQRVDSLLTNLRDAFDRIARVEIVVQQP